MLYIQLNLFGLAGTSGSAIKYVKHDLVSPGIRLSYVFSALLYGVYLDGTDLGRAKHARSEQSSLAWPPRRTCAKGLYGLVLDTSSRTYIHNFNNLP